jgi:hypothetical protein
LAYPTLKAALLKKAAASTVEDLRAAIAVAINLITENDCRGFFTAAGNGSV